MPAFGRSLARFSSGAHFTVSLKREPVSSEEARCTSSGIHVMGGGLLSEAFLFAPSTSTLMALLAALPVALALYLYCRSRAWRIRPALSLGKLEAIECERALLLYRKAARRRQEIWRHREPARAPWRAWLRARSDFRKRYGQELDELGRYARDLRATIIRLRGRPIRRYKSWIRLVSSRCALGRSLGCYGVVLALLVVSFYAAEAWSWGPGATADFEIFVLWQNLEGRLLLANWLASSFAAAATPLLYVIRRSQMYRKHALHVRVLSELAATDPDRLIGQRDGDGEEHEEAADAAAEDAPEAPLAVVEDAWFDVLGVGPSATIDDVKQAYKELVKQNHPDRVHSMAPAFRELAEAETKKLNIAYADALSYFRQDDMAAA
jgi:DnaJ-domain-containing protein 1